MIGIFLFLTLYSQEYAPSEEDLLQMRKGEVSIDD